MRMSALPSGAVLAPMSLTLEWPSRVFLPSMVKWVPPRWPTTTWLELGSSRSGTWTCTPAKTYGDPLGVGRHLGQVVVADADVADRRRRTGTRPSWRRAGPGPGGSAGSRCRCCPPAAPGSARRGARRLGGRRRCWWCSRSGRRCRRRCRRAARSATPPARSGWPASSPRWPSQVSRPFPPSSSSRPLPPSIVSAPRWPRMTSWPGPPSAVSLPPGPRSIRSAPRLPRHGVVAASGADDVGVRRAR